MEDRFSMRREHRNSDLKHRASRNRRDKSERQQPWGGLKPIITGAIGDAKHHTTVASVANKPGDKKRAA